MKSLFDDKDVLFAEAFEALSVLLRLNCWQSWSILAKQRGLKEALTLFTEVPRLQIVDYGEMVNTVTIDEAMLPRHELSWVQDLLLDNLILNSNLFVRPIGPDLV